MTEKLNISRELDEQVAKLLLRYSAILIGLRGDNEYRPCGCGTFVRSGEQHFILTAAHCAAALEEWESRLQALG